MSNQRLLLKKDKEKHFLSNFLLYYSKFHPDLSNYSIVDFESPDFIIEANNVKYAIEITEFFNGRKRKNSGSVEKLILSKKEKLLEYIKSAYERKCSILLNVSIVWSDYDFSQLDNSTMLKIAGIFSDKLVEITRLDPPIIWAFNNLDIFVKGNVLIKYLSWINVSYKNPIDAPENFFSFSESGSTDDPIPELRRIINYKLCKLDSYIYNLEKQKLPYNRLWLLIDANGRYISSSADFEKIRNSFPLEIYKLERLFKYSFDNVFIYDMCFNNFAQIK